MSIFAKLSLAAGCVALIGTASMAGRYDGLVDAFRNLPNPPRIEPTPVPRQFEEARLQNQARHAWEAENYDGTLRQADWEARGINDQRALQSHISDVRANADYYRQVDEYRHAYGQLDHGASTQGTVVVDNFNPSVNDGGTAFTNPNIFEYIDGLRRSGG